MTNSDPIGSESLPSRFLVLFLATILVGIVSGVAGTFLGLLLRGIQHLAFGFSPWSLVSKETFLEGVKASSSIRRLTVLFICGLTAGLGWWAIFKYASRPVSVAQAIKSKQSLPLFTTITHALLQIVTVALGSPLGRETAPREWGAAFAQRISKTLGLSPKETTLFIACGAGGGFAARSVPGEMRQILS